MLSTPFPALYSLLTALAYTGFLWPDEKKRNNTFQPAEMGILQKVILSPVQSASSNEEFRVH